jgi:hypothetical protein
MRGIMKGRERKGEEGDRTGRTWERKGFSPNNWALRVTAAAPNHTMTKTAAKTMEAESPGAVRDKMIESKRQTSKGPHKSPE